MPPGKPRRIDYVDIEKLPDAPTNAKRHEPSLIDQSLDRFGFVEPIVIDERTGRLVAGHGRKDELRRKRDQGDPPPGRDRQRPGRAMARPGRQRVGVRR